MTARVYIFSDFHKNIAEQSKDFGVAQLIKNTFLPEHPVFKDSFEILNIWAIQTSSAFVKFYAFFLVKLLFGI